MTSPACRSITPWQAGLAWLVWLAVCLVLAGSASAASGVLVILSERAEAYEQAARAFEDGLAGRYPVRIAALDGFAPEDMRVAAGDSLLVVPVGLRAARFVAEHLPPRASVLALLVPRRAFAALAWPSSGGGDVSAVYLDQPAKRSLRLIRLLDARLDRVGVLVSASAGEEARGVERELAQAAQVEGQSILFQPVVEGRDQADALRRLLPNTDVLLLTADSQVVNSANLQNLLLTSYRYRKPVVGYSARLTVAGAVASVYSTPAQAGSEGARMAAAWHPASGALPAPRHADEFEVAVNERVARSLGLALPDARELRRRMAGPP